MSNPTTEWYKQNFKDSLKSKGRLLPVVSQVLANKTADRNSHRDTQHLHPSEISKKDWCPRSSWYKIKGYEGAEESMSFGRLNIFEEGHAIHEKWQGWLREAGVLAGTWECMGCGSRWHAVSPDSCDGCGYLDVVYREVPIHSDEYRIIGHADGEIQDSQGKALLEIKSVGLGSLRWENPTLFNAYTSGEVKFEDLFKNIKKPFASHIRQGSLYMLCTGIHTIVFVYEWKPTQEVKEFVVEFQQELIQPVLDGCKEVIKHLDMDIVPERPQWATTPTANGCKFCPYKKVCWE